MNKTAIIYHEDYLLHDSGKFHPERKERLIATINYFKTKGILDFVPILTPKPATEKDILRVHTKEHLDFIKNLSTAGGGVIDSDTLVTKDTFNVAKLAAGGVIIAGEIIMQEKFKNSFAFVRPPGHHATQNQAMGFCYFNNVAIAIRYLQEKYHSLRRIFLLDWDTHAFNGTMDVFYDDPSVLNVSIHQDPTSFYPGTGFAGQTGEGKGTGYTVNIPLHPGAGDDDYLFVMNNLIIPLIDSYKPQMIVISSGIDSHKFDPISDMQLTERGYGIMTSLLMRKAEDYSEGRLFVELEGGYNLNSLARSNYEILRSLLGERKLIYPLFQEDNVMESTEHTMDSLKHIFGNYHDI